MLAACRPEVALKAPGFLYVRQEEEAPKGPRKSGSGELGVLGARNTKPHAQDYRQHDDPGTMR